MEQHEFRDVVFKGCTRPAMKFGVPMVPLIIAVCSVAIITNLTTMWTAALVVPVVLVMAEVTRTDDQKWRLIGLWLYCRIKCLNKNARFWNASTYSPINYRKR